MLSEYSWSPRQENWASLKSILCKKGAHDSPPTENVVLWLHGSGASMKDLLPYLYQLLYWDQAPYDHVFLQAPFSQPFPPGWLWYPVEEQLKQLIHHPHPEKINPAEVSLPEEFYHCRKALKKAIVELKKSYKKAIMIGFSQGGMMALDYVLNEQIFTPHDFLQALVLLSTTVSTPEKDELWPKEDMSLPIFQSHGRSDPVLPFALGETLAHSLKACNPHFTFHPFQGDHSIPPSVIEVLDQWLEKQI